MPRKLLMQYVDSNEFTLLKAYKRRNTLNPDIWFSAQALAATHCGSPPNPFVPIVSGESDKERRERQAKAAEDAMDRE